MESIRLDIPVSSGCLLDVDVMSNDEWVGIFDFGGVQKIFWKNFIEIPYHCRYPIIRYISREALVLIDGVGDGNTSNAWVFDQSGHMLREFYVGYGISDVMVSREYLICTYDDVAISEGGCPQSEGIFFFSHEGEQRFGYKSMFGKDAVEIDDCYCALVDNNNLMFIPYMDFPLVSIDLLKLNQKVIDIPEGIYGASAIAKCRDSLFVFGPFDHESEFYKWNMINGNMARLDMAINPKRIRGVSGGRFVVVDDCSCFIISSVCGYN